MKLEEVGAEAWRELVATCTRSSIYQDPRWLELIERVYPRLPVVRCAGFGEDGELRWLLPLVPITPLFRRRPILISLPFGNYGGFLLPRDRPAEITEEDLEILRGWFARSPAFALEIRELQKPAHGLEVDDQFERYELELAQDCETLWKSRLNGNARTSVRKADREGVEILVDPPGALDALQELYEHQSSQAGTPIHHPSWYPELARAFAAEQTLVLARRGDDWVGAAQLLQSGDASILHMVATASRDRGVPVADRLYWGCLEHLVEVGRSRSLDFGRTRNDPGQRFFKRKWGGTAHPIHYAYLRKPGESIPRLLPDNPKLRTPIEMWRRLPMALKRRIGPHLRTRIPT